MIDQGLGESYITKDIGKKEKELIGGLPKERGRSQLAWKEALMDGQKGGGVK